MSLVQRLGSLFGSLTDHDLATNMVEGPVPIDNDDTLAAADRAAATPDAAGAAGPDALGTLTGQRIRARVHASLFEGPDEPVTVGHYRILKRLGAGGMGVVYLGYDTRLDRKVAIKLLGGEREHAALSERLRREGKALARLSDPGIVQVYEVGEHDGHVFVAMEFVEGETLRVWSKAAPRSLREILRVFVSAARALAAAHDAGLVHRDFKPDNVLVGANGRPRLLDFGLARSLDQPTSDSPPSIPAAGDASMLVLTRTGQLTGTPAYMAAEQFAGGITDARTDQFAFCVALHEALCDERPFSGGNLAELMTNVLEGRRSTPARNRRIPGWLRELLSRGLSTRADDRHPSMHVIATELARDRLRRPLMIIGGVVVTVALALGWNAWSSRQQEHDSATSQLRDEVGGQRTRAETAEGELLRRADALTFAEAQSLLARDPTRAVAMLENLRPEAIEWGTDAWHVATSAALRGIADHVIAIPSAEHVVGLTADGSAAIACGRRPLVAGNAAPCRAIAIADGKSFALPSQVEGSDEPSFSPSSTKIVAYDDHGATILDRAGNTAWVLPLSPGDAVGHWSAFSPDESFFALELAPSKGATDSRTILVWSLATQQPIAERRTLPPGYPLVPEADGALRLTHRDGAVDRIAADGTRTRLAVVPRDRMPCQGHRMLAAWLGDDAIEVVGLDGRRSRVEHAAIADTRDCAIDPVTGRTLVADAVGRVTLLDAEGSHELTPPSGSPVDLWIANDGLRAIAVLLGGSKRIFDLRDRSSVHMPDATGALYALDATGALVTVERSELRRWPLELDRTLFGHTGPVDALRWSARGLVSAGTDGTLRRWDDAGQSHVLWHQPQPIAAIGMQGDTAFVLQSTGIGAIALGGPDVAFTPTAAEPLPMPHAAGTTAAVGIGQMAALQRMVRENTTFSDDGRWAARPRRRAAAAVRARRRILGAGCRQALA
jgi:serine/threonine protein kinase